jgi:hypothetical protein
VRAYDAADGALALTLAPVLFRPACAARRAIVRPGCSSCVLPVSVEFEALLFAAPLCADKHETGTSSKNPLRLHIRIRIYPLSVIHINSILSCASAGRCVLPALQGVRSR